jgi:hypothetical protein
MTPIISIQLAILAQAGYYCEGAGCLSRLYGNHREGAVAGWSKNEWDRDALPRRAALGFRQGRAPLHINTLHINTSQY